MPRTFHRKQAHVIRIIKKEPGILQHRIFEVLRNLKPDGILNAQNRIPPSPDVVRHRIKRLKGPVIPVDDNVIAGQVALLRVEAVEQCPADQFERVLQINERPRLLLQDGVGFADGFRTHWAATVNLADYESVPEISA